MRFLVTRPEPDCRRTADRLRSMGQEADEAPVLRNVPCPPDRFDLEEVAALALSSRWAVSVLRDHAQIASLQRLPVFTVGDATANTCREAGFSEVHSAAGDVAALARLILDSRDRLSPGHVLYPAAADRAGNLEGLLAAGGLACRPVAIYRMEPAQSLPDTALDALRAGAYDGVLIYSRRSAQAFLSLIKAQLPGHEFSGMRAYALSPQAAEPISSGFTVQVAAAPNEQALFDLALAEC